MSREDNQKRLMELLAVSKCMDCPEDDLRVLTFDHRNPKTKKDTISSLIHKGHSWNIIEKELAKCDCVCLNCHQKRECKRGNGKRQQFYDRTRGSKKS